MCTTIVMDYNGGSVLARNLDYEVPLEYNVLYLPQGYTYGQDLLGNDLKAKYKALGLAFYNYDPLKDGVNEHGLVGCTNYFHAMNIHADHVDESKFNISSLDYLNYALTNFKNVEELVADLPNIRVSTKDSEGNKIICPDFHHIFVDTTGRCVVVQPEKGKYIYFENPYKVMTNSPSFPRHIKRLHKCMDPNNIESFKGAKDLPGGYDPVSRFIKAYYLNKTHVKPKSTREALEASYTIMEMMKMSEGMFYSDIHQYHTYTRYICAYDTKNRLLTARSHNNSKVYQLSIEALEGMGRTAIPFKTNLEIEKFNLNQCIKKTE